MSGPARRPQASSPDCLGIGELACPPCQATDTVAVRRFKCAAVWVDLTAPDGQRERRCGQLVPVPDALCVDHVRQQRRLDEVTAAAATTARGARDRGANPPASGLVGVPRPLTIPRATWRP